MIYKRNTNEIDNIIWNYSVLCATIFDVDDLCFFDGPCVVEWRGREDAWKS